MQAKLRRGTVGVVQAGSTFSECIKLAARRLGRSVRRQLDLQRQFDRQTVRRLEPIGAELERN